MKRQSNEFSVDTFFFFFYILFTVHHMSKIHVCGDISEKDLSDISDIMLLVHAVLSKTDKYESGNILRCLLHVSQQFGLAKMS